MKHPAGFGVKYGRSSGVAGRSIAVPVREHFHNGMLRRLTIAGVATERDAPAVAAEVEAPRTARRGTARALPITVEPTMTTPAGRVTAPASQSSEFVHSVTGSDPHGLDADNDGRGCE